MPSPVPKVALHLWRDDARVLYDWIENADLNAIPIEHPAEKAALSNLVGWLEFDGDGPYISAEEMRVARDEVSRGGTRSDASVPKVQVDLWRPDVLVLYAWLDRVELETLPGADDADRRALAALRDCLEVDFPDGPRATPQEINAARADVARDMALLDLVMGKSGRVEKLLDEFAERHPNALLRVGGETFVAIDSVVALLAEVERQGLRVLGLEDNLVDVDAGDIFPALSRCANFSQVSTAKQSVSMARELVRGGWSTPPTPADRMHSDAIGRHMIAIVLDEPAP